MGARLGREPQEPPASDRAEEVAEEAAEEAAKPVQRLYRHQHLPKPMKLQESYAAEGAEEAPTTLMIRNVPNRYMPRELLTEIEDMGFSGTFNFLYLPMDRHGWRRQRGTGKKGTPSNVGYAFVNFVDPATAQRFMTLAQGYTFKGAGPGRTAVISVAHIQGLEANMAHYENAAVNGGAPGEREGPILLPALAPALGLQSVDAAMEPAKVEVSTGASAIVVAEDGQEPAKILLGSFMKERIERGRDAASKPWGSDAKPVGGGAGAGSGSA